MAGRLIHGSPLLHRAVTPAAWGSWLREPIHHLQCSPMNRFGMTYWPVFPGERFPATAGSKLSKSVLKYYINWVYPLLIQLSKMVFDLCRKRRRTLPWYCHLACSSTCLTSSLENKQTQPRDKTAPAIRSSVQHGRVAFEKGRLLKSTALCVGR